MMKGFLFFLVMFSAGTAFAAPSKKEATAYVNEIKAVVKAGDEALKIGSTEALHNQSVRAKKMRDRRETLFVDADACSFAAHSAYNLWHQKLLQFQRPSTLGDQFIKRANEDYRDNMAACKKSLAQLK